MVCEDAEFQLEMWEDSLNTLRKRSTDDESEISFWFQYIMCGDEAIFDCQAVS